MNHIEFLSELEKEIDSAEGLTADGKAQLLGLHSLVSHILRQLNTIETQVTVTKAKVNAIEAILSVGE